MSLSFVLINECPRPEIVNHNKSFFTKLGPPWKYIFFSPEYPRKGSDLVPFKLRNQFELQIMGPTFFNFSVGSGFKIR